MAHKCEYEATLKYDGRRKLFYQEYIAIWKNRRQLVFKKYEDGQNYASCNLYWSQLAGWLVSFEGEKISNNPYNYYGEQIADKNKLYPTQYEFTPCYVDAKPVNWEQLTIDHPEFKFLFKKIFSRLTDYTLPIIHTYREHPEIETLVEMEQYRLALDKRLFKLNKAKLKKVISFVKANSDCYNMTLNDAFYCIKHNIMLKQLINHRESESLKLFEYLEKQKVHISYYKDYLNMVKDAGHNPKEEYWAFPKSLNDAHRKILDELNAIREAKERAKREAREKELNQHAKYFIGLSKRTKKEIDGYEVVIPDNVGMIVDTAEKLHQCLIRCSYDKKMFVEKKSLLVIIRKDNEPIATAEIGWNKELRQFYGDEHDRNNCDPSDEVERVMKKWLSEVKISKPREREAQTYAL